MRRPVRQPPQGRTYTIPAPVRGWVENENLAQNQGQGASVFENMFPLTSTVRVRGGKLRVATIGAPVVSMMSYMAGAKSRLFAASATGLFDITASSTTAPEPIRAITGGRFSSVQIDTGGGQFLIAANGRDPVSVFDGASWTNAAITGIDSALISQVWIHANRIWGVRRGSLKAYYLPNDQFGGAALDLNLGGVFQAGGTLAFGGTWSADSGNGFGDRCVFVSDQGEIAVYEGINPSDPADWRLVGRYDIGSPVSRQTIRAGGDLLIATTDGIVPMSQIVSKDPAALSMAAVSYPIEPSWQRMVRAIDGVGRVQMLKWQRESMGLIGLPHRSDTFVVNLQTGAWARWTGQDIQCLVLHDDLAFFGSRDGHIYQVEGSGSDDGEIYVARMSGLPEHLNAPGAVKTVRMARATFRSLGQFHASLSVATDYRREFPPPPSVVSGT